MRLDTRRATARLLEVMQENLIDVRDFDDPDVDPGKLVSELVAMLDELRRGDTLVRARDVELVGQVAYRERVSLGDDEAKARGRPHHALGGVP
jgi:hypothetical protein